MGAAAGGVDRSGKKGDLKKGFSWKGRELNLPNPMGEKKT